MKTKFVYVVASSAEDIYLEQAIVSAWSLRYYNPDAHIVLVCDQDTRTLLDGGWHKDYVSLFDEHIVCRYEASQSMMERSRQMKTTLRSIISGDFLYLDTDTIVCRDLSFIDAYTFDLGLVLDNNCPFDKFLIHDCVVSQMKQCYHMDVNQETVYYNSGVIYAKDTDLVHTFFSKWHENWCYEIEHTDSMKDQPPLMKTNIDMGYVITEMDGIMNCQIVASIRYLYNAAIIHIYNDFIGRDSSITPFHSTETYSQIKQIGFTNDWKTKVIHFKEEAFCSPSFVLGESNSKLWRTLNEEGTFLFTVRILQKIHEKHPLLFSVVKKVLTFICRIM